MKRRFFLLAAPAIVGAPSLMRVSTRALWALPPLVDLPVGIIAYDVEKWGWIVSRYPDPALPIYVNEVIVSDMIDRWITEPICEAFERELVKA